MYKKCNRVIHYNITFDASIYNILKVHKIKFAYDFLIIFLKLAEELKSSNLITKYTKM